MRKLSWPLLAAVLISVPAQAQVLITEVQPNPNGSDNAEWIEIHNTGMAGVSIAGWIINDFGPSTPRQYEFPVGTMLAADQVIIVTKQADAYIAMAALDMLAVATPDYELAEGADNMAVTNLPVLVQGTGALALGNSGDGVQISNAMGVVQSTAEWGNGRTEVPGAPSAGPGSGETIGRIANTGSSDVDFAVQMPNPGTGYNGALPVPPSISNELRAPAVFVHGAAFNVSADVTDADGVAGVEMYFATSTDLTSAANGAYVALTPTQTMGNYAVSGVTNAPAMGLSVPVPTTFNEQYIRYFIYALDNNADEGSAPAMAVTAASNPNFYWENVLPPTALTPLAIARAQNMSELPIWDGHSVRVEGIVTTTKESFLAGRTNFYIASSAMGAIEAIRVFDDQLIPATLTPGDRVVVTGKIAAYRGVRQLGRDERGGVNVSGPEITVQVMGTGAVPMHTVTIAQLLTVGEQYESSLVEIVGVNFSGAVPMTWPSNANINVTDGTGTLSVRVISATDLAGASAPAGPFVLRGILSQFAPGGTGGYQLQPRGAADVIAMTPMPDAGVVDTGVDAGNADTGVTPDAGTADTGVTPDAGTADTGVTPDAGTMDTGATPDAGTVDTGVVDTGVVDTGVVDTGVVDTGVVDTGVVDTGMTIDAGMPAMDAGTPVDSGVAADAGSNPVDTGVIGGGTGGTTRDSGGCTCATPADASSNLPFAFLAAFGLFFIRRRR